MDKQFCIVHGLVESDCDCAPEVAGARAFVKKHECIGLPSLVRAGGLPSHIDPKDRDGIYTQVVRRTYDGTAFGGHGCWNNEVVSFRKKGDDTSEHLAFDMLEMGFDLETIKDALAQVFSHLDRMQREIAIENGLNLQKETDDAAADRLDELLMRAHRAGCCLDSCEVCDAR